MTPRQMRYLIAHPHAHASVLSGRPLPQEFEPRSALIDVLSAISSRDRAAIQGLVVDSRLGYSGTRRFATAEQAFRWVRPEQEMLETDAYPAGSWMNARSSQRLTIDDVADCASKTPQGLLERYPRLRRKG